MMFTRIAASMLTTLVASGSTACTKQRNTPPKYSEHHAVDATAPAQQPVAAPVRPPQDPVEIVNAAAADLAARLDVAVTMIQVLAIEPVVWNDGSLGCPQPDQSYATAQVAGLRVLFAHAGKNYQYHAANSGRMLLCPNPQVLAAPYAKE